MRLKEQKPTSQPARCIYCDSTCGPFSEEHAIPACLGEFRGFPPIRNRVCKGCNGNIGKAEEQFCRSGPEAFFRRLLGIGGRKSHKKVNPFERGSGGRKPIDFVADHPQLGIPMLWELNAGQRTVREVRQIVVVDKRGKAFPIRIPTWMKEPKQFRQAISDKGIAKIKKAYAFADEDETPWVQGLLQGLGESSGWKKGEPVTINNPVATFQATAGYFRAIAKCAFHYFLAVVPEIRGSEPQFHDLRDFIMKGGDVNHFFSQESTPIIRLPRPGLRPSQYGHIVAVDWQEGKVWARCQYFLGPDYEPPVSRIRIGENVDKLSVDCLKEKGGKGHFFVYFSGGRRGRFDGEVSELIIAQ